jgi:hypothetical protein
MWQYPQTEMLCKRKRKEVKIQEFGYRGTTNVEPEMYDYTSNNWSHWNSNEKLREKFGSCTRKTFDIFATEDLKHHTYYGNFNFWPKHVVSLLEYNIFITKLCCLTTLTPLIIYYGKYCSVKLKPQRWGSPLVQEKYLEDKACDKIR